MASRRISALQPRVRELAERWLGTLSEFGVDVLVYCTYRSPDEQNELWRQGRTEPGKRVTNAKAWQSLHQYGRAWDAVPMRGGKPVWRYSEDDPDWEKMVEVAEKLGIEWGGRWRRPDYAHWQVSDGKSWRQLYREERWEPSV